MTIVPYAVLQAASVCVVEDDLVFSDALSGLIFKLAVRELEHLFRALASQRRITFISSDRWPHVLKNHNVVP